MLLQEDIEPAYVYGIGKYYYNGLPDLTPVEYYRQAIDHLRAGEEGKAFALLNQ